MLLLASSVLLQSSTIAEFETNLFLINDCSVSLERVFSEKDRTQREIALSELIDRKCGHRGGVILINVNFEDHWNDSSGVGTIYTRTYQATERFKESGVEKVAVRAKGSALFRQAFFDMSDGRSDGINLAIDPISPRNSFQMYGLYNIAKALDSRTYTKKLPFMVFSPHSIEQTESFLHGKLGRKIENILLCKEGMTQSQNRIVLPQFPGKVHHYRLGYSKRKGHYANPLDVRRF